MKKAPLYGQIDVSFGTSPRRRPEIASGALTKKYRQRTTPVPFRFNGSTLQPFNVSRSHSLRLRKKHEHARTARGGQRKLFLLGTLWDCHAIGMAANGLIVGKEHEVMSPVPGNLVQCQMPAAGDFARQRQFFPM